MQPKRGSRSSLLLIELIITLFFFLLISVFCIQIYAKTYTISRKSRELNQAQNLVSSAAQVLQHAGTSLEHWQTFFPESEHTEDSFRIYYDENFTACPFAEASYMLAVEFLADETGKITFFREEEPVYSLNIRYHIPNRI